MTIKNLIRKLSHPTTIKIVALIVIVGFFFVSQTFAQTETTSTGLVNIQKGLNDILRLCSRLRVILAILAGKLMTNDRVYASIIHMDIYLRKIWNIMKNFANFALIGIVLFNIVQNLVGKDKMNVKDIITKTLVAGILIQASWFLVGALVDLSTIATSAVGAFPSSFLGSNVELQNDIKDRIGNTPKRLLIDIMGSTGSSITPIDNTPTPTDGREEVMPTYNSVSGPLIYLGFSVFKFQNYMSVGDNAGAEQLTISFLLRVIVILFYTLGLALLFIANIIRVAFLRIFVIATPLIILSRLFFKDKGFEGKSSGGLGEYLSFKVMLDLIFKPVIFVAGFSMILIFVVSIQKIMEGTLPKEINGVTISVVSGSSTLSVADISTIQVKENSVRGQDPLDLNGTEIKETGQTIFVNLIIFFLTIFLMRKFIKISATSGKGPVSKVMGKVTEGIEGFAKTLPVLPLAGGASLNATQEFTKKNRDKLLGGVGLDKSGNRGEMQKGGVFEKQEDKFRERVAGEVIWKGSDYSRLNKLAGATNTADFFTTSKTLSQERKGGLSITNATWLASLQKALQDDVRAKAQGFTGKLTDTKPETLQAYFTSKNVGVLFDKLGGTDNILSGSSKIKPTTYDQLKDIVFGASTEKK